MPSFSHIVGVMSGSSLDGLDMALCRFRFSELTEWKLIKADTISFPDEILSKLMLIRQMKARELFRFETEFSKFLAACVRDFISGVIEPVDAVASHGHTVFHHPEEGFTVQIGSGAILAEYTGLPAVVDFRSNDIAAGGHGAPLVPIAERDLFRGYNLYLNLGGIANLSIHKESEIRAFDSCPCNQILNAVAARRGLSFDQNGSLARRGNINKHLLQDWKNMDYFHKAPPKSLDNAWVMSKFYDRVSLNSMEDEDILRTMVEFISYQIAFDIDSYADSSDGRTCEMMVSGGGGHNTFLVERLSDLLRRQEIRVVIPDREILDYKEAILMAYMGYLRIAQRDNTIPGVTGALNPTTGGGIYVSSGVRPAII